MPLVGGELPDFRRLVSAFDDRKTLLAVETSHAIRRVGPGDTRVEILHDLPLREEELDLLGVFELKRTQQEPFDFEGGRHP